MPVKSPATYTLNTQHIDDYSTKEISDLYAQNGINVRRYFDGLSTIQLYQCNDTGYRFFYPEQIFGDDSFYRDCYATIPGYYHVNRWEHQKAKKLVPTGSRLLEVGCGDGFFLSTVKQQCSTIKGIELNQHAVAAAQKKGLPVSDQSMEALAQSGEKYDVVCCFQVLEHIYDVKAFLESMIQLGKPGALLMVAVPNNNPYLFKRDRKHFLNLPPHHANWWNKESLAKLSDFYPLEVQSIDYEPLYEVKMWYQAQVKHYEQTTPLLATILKVIPRPLYKAVLKLFRSRIEGKTLLAVYKIKGNG